jgi:DNA-binding NtrC family response regulator
MKHVLVVDDENGTRQSLQAVFAGVYEVSTADGAEAARRVLLEKPADLILLDVRMPGKDGLTFLKDLQSLYPEIPVVMISALTSVRPVVEAIRVGAYDFLTKPFDVQDVLRVSRRAIESAALQRRVATLETDISREFPVRNIVGTSPAFVRVLDDVRKAADTDASVLISGESGTGKELAARLLHTSSNRRDEPFVAVHCASLSETLMESELFGHERGAFTNADRQKPGRFDLAGSGTLFFDEVSEMSPSTQVKLLRVLQEKEFMRVGGTQVIRTNARIVAATARDLKIEVAEGRFRGDLFYRLSVVPVRLPPLRERHGDIPLLARHFLAQFRQSASAQAEDFDTPAMDLLCRYPWPGNVRELRNIVERVIVLHRQDRHVTAEMLPEEFQQPGAESPAVGAGVASGLSLEDSVNVFERRRIEDALRAAGGVQTRAAQRLGTTRRILRYRMEKLNISSSEYGAPAETEGPEG